MSTNPAKPLSKMSSCSAGPIERAHLRRVSVMIPLTKIWHAPKRDGFCFKKLGARHGFLVFLSPQDSHDPQHIKRCLPYSSLVAMVTYNATLPSHDLVAELLSTNNTLNVVAVVGMFLFGILTAYGIYLTWHHQRWERALERRRHKTAFSSRSFL